MDQRLTNEEKSKPQNERSEMGLIEKINFVVKNDFKRISYTEAIDILKNLNQIKRKSLNILLKIGEQIFKVNMKGF